MSEDATDRRVWPSEPLAIEGPTIRLREATLDDAEVVDARAGDAEMIGEYNDFGLPQPKSLAENPANGKRMVSPVPKARGHGHETEAQRLFAQLLFRTFDIERVEASTDVDSLAEQRSLEKAGFTREGVARRAQSRAGAYHDLVNYSVLREDL